MKNMIMINLKKIIFNLFNIKTLFMLMTGFIYVLLSANSQATEVSKMIGVYQSGNDDHYLWVSDNWKGITNKWKDLGKDNLRLIDIERYYINDKPSYAGVWRHGKGKHALWRTDSWSKFVNRWKDYSSQGMKLVDIETYLSGGKRHYLGVWNAGQYSTALWHAKSWTAFLDKWKELSKSGQRLIDIESYVSGNATEYIGVFKKGSDGHYLWKTSSWTDFVNKWKELAKDKLRLIDIERVLENKQFKYVGVFRSGKNNYALYNEKPKKFFKAWNNFSDNKLRLIDLELVISGSKPAIPKPTSKPASKSACGSIGPYRITGKYKLKGQQYGANHIKENMSTDSAISSEDNTPGAHLSGQVNSVKLVAGVCVDKGEVEYTLSYRGNVWRPLSLVNRVKAGQCKCHWKTTAWPERMQFLSTVKVKKPNTVYTHKASNCLRPWRDKCEIKTSDGWK